MVVALTIFPSLEPLKTVKSTILIDVGLNVKDLRGGCGGIDCGVSVEDVKS